MVQYSDLLGYFPAYFGNVFVKLQLVVNSNPKQIKLFADRSDCVLNSKSPISLNELIKPRTSSYELRGKDALRLPKVNTTKYGLKSWHYLAPKIWNNIPDAAKSCTTYKAFLKRLSDTDISRHC